MLEYLEQLNLVSMMLRLTLAGLFGGLIGIERGHKHRPAGCRTYFIVCMGAALSMILSQYEALLLSTDWAAVAEGIGIKTDVSRFGAQVINGIGFLGAGTIIVTGRQEVKGLTTAAGLWASACMGLAIGAGFYAAAVVGFLYIILTFFVFNHLGAWVIAHARNMDFYLEYASTDSLPEIIALIKSMDIRVFSVDINKVKNGDLVTRSAIFSVQLPKKLTHAGVMAGLAAKDGVLTIEEI